MELPGTEAVKKAVEANVGFAFVSGFSVDPAPKDLRILNFKNPELSRYMEVIYRRQKYFSPVAQKFREYVHAYAREHLRDLPPLGHRKSHK